MIAMDGFWLKMPKGHPRYRFGQIFLSHCQTNHRFFLAHKEMSHFIIENHEKGFKKILNTLNFDMVT